MFQLVIGISAHMFSGYFVQSMVGIRVDMMACVDLMQLIMPSLARHLEEMLPPELVVQGPLQTLFIEYLPPTTVLRLLDVLFLSCLHPRFTEPHTVVAFVNMSILEVAGPNIMNLEPFEAGDIKSIYTEAAQSRYDGDRLFAKAPELWQPSWHFPALI